MGRERYTSRAEAQAYIIQRPLLECLKISCPDLKYGLETQGRRLFIISFFVSFLWLDKLCKMLWIR
jgi:hypothetical protein